MIIIIKMGRILLQAMLEPQPAVALRDPFFLSSFSPFLLLLFSSLLSQSLWRTEYTGASVVTVAMAFQRRRNHYYHRFRFLIPFISAISAGLLLFFALLSFLAPSPNDSHHHRLIPPVFVSSHFLFRVFFYSLFIFLF